MSRFSVLAAAPALLALSCGNGTARPDTAPALARPPASCRGSATTLVATVGRAIGEPPLYAADFGPRRAMLHVENGPLTARGWRVKVLFVLDAQATQRISVRGTRLGGSGALWFRVTGRRVAKTAAIDPTVPAVPYDGSSRWKDYPTYFFLPRAGCFRLEARWPGGGWTKVFAGGR
jgi:hypothetical protein